MRELRNYFREVNMKEYKVIHVRVPTQKTCYSVLEAVMNYLEDKAVDGFKVEQVVEFSDKRIGLLCSQEGLYDITSDNTFHHLF